MTIPPRPWSVDPRINEIQADDGCYIVDCSLATTEQARPTAELIVRLVNAEPEIVAALEAAASVLNIDGTSHPGAQHEQALELVRAALSRLRP